MNSNSVSYDPDINHFASNCGTNNTVRGSFTTDPSDSRLDLEERRRRIVSGIERHLNDIDVNTNDNSRGRYRSEHQKSRGDFYHSRSNPYEKYVNNNIGYGSDLDKGYVLRRGDIQHMIRKENGANEYKMYIINRFCPEP